MMTTQEYNKLYLQYLQEFLQEGHSILFESEERKKEAEQQEKRTSKEIERQKKIMSIFKNAGKGKLSSDGIKKLAAQIENNDIRYEGFPEWVLETWLKADQHSAIPLKDNNYLDVDSIVAGEDSFDIENLTYGGVVVNHNRKNIGGVQAINLVRSELLDDEAVGKLQKLLSFQRAAIEATSLIERKQKKEGGPGSLGMNNPMDGGGGSNTTGAGGGAVGGGGAGGGIGGGADLTGTSPTGDTGDVPMDKDGSPDLSGGAQSAPTSGGGSDQTANGGQAPDGTTVGNPNPTPEPSPKQDTKTVDKKKFKVHLK